MKKIKQEKAITLIALIVTIVVLIVLATVAISTVKNTDIIGYANTAVIKHKEGEDTENSVLQGYDTLINKYIHSPVEIKYFLGDFENFDDAYHTGAEICKHCGIVVRIWSTERHNYDATGKCIKCGYEKECKSEYSYDGSHNTFDSDMYVDLGDKGHMVYTHCNLCNSLVYTSLSSHEFDSGGFCSRCHYYSPSHNTISY